MEAMKYVEYPQNGKITIELPNFLKTEKQLEVIVLPYVPDEEIEKKKNAFDPRKFRGSAKQDLGKEEGENRMSVDLIDPLLYKS